LLFSRYIMGQAMRRDGTHIDISPTLLLTLSILSFALIHSFVGLLLCVCRVV
jgi:hypothetical protein